MRVNVIGTGFMGKQITSLLSIIGFDILVWEKNDNNLKDELKTQIKKIERILKVKSKGSISVVNQLGKLENNFTIETVTENLEIKKSIFKSLSFKDNLFSNTSSIKLSSLGDNINGFHFMNPVTVKVIELCKVKNFSEEKLNVIINELKKISYQFFNVTDTPGYIINKILFKDISFFFYLIEVEKINILDLQKIYLSDLKKFDPVKIINLIGVDTCLQILINLNRHDSEYYVPNSLKKSINLRILGNKNKTHFKIL